MWFESETDRGIYLRRSDTVDDTAHLLPGAMRFNFRGPRCSGTRECGGKPTWRYDEQREFPNST